MPRRHPRALLAVFAALASSIAAAEPSASVGRGEWFVRASLPCHLRAESRTLATDDKDAAVAEVNGWVEAHDGKPAPSGYAFPMWVIPRKELGAFDAFLRTQGRIVRRGTLLPNSVDSLVSTAGGPGARGWKMVDARTIAAQRRALARDVDAFNERADRLPAVTNLSTAYLEALDEISEALQKYSESVSVQVAAMDRTEDANRPMVDPTQRHFILRGACDGWGVLRIPRRFVGNEDYLTWSDTNNLGLEWVRTVVARVDVPDVAEVARKIDAALAALGAKASSIEPSPAGFFTGPRAEGRASLRGYWIPRERLDEARSAVAAQARLQHWTLQSGQGGPGFDGIARWAAELQTELQDEPDRLTAYPAIQSLVLAHLDRMGPYSEPALMSATHELLGLEIRKDGTADQGPSSALPSGPPPPPGAGR